MKAIMMSIRPQHTCNIFNLIKLWEIRKKFPKDYVGWVYIYCTINGGCIAKNANKYTYYKKGYTTRSGEVVARFWCDKVEEHKDFGMFPYSKLRYNKATCLNEEEIEDYGFIDDKGFVPLYAVHITKLEIFDKPKEISEFIRDTGRRMLVGNDLIPYCEPLTRAPQSWCYIEI